MKIVRHGERGWERPGLLDADGVMRDMSTLIRDWTPAELEPATLARLAAVEPQSLPALPAGTRLGVPGAAAAASRGARGFASRGVTP